MRRKDGVEVVDLREEHQSEPLEAFALDDYAIELARGRSEGRNVRDGKEASDAAEVVVAADAVAAAKNAIGREEGETGMWLECEEALTLSSVLLEERHKGDDGCGTGSYVWFIAHDENE